MNIIITSFQWIYRRWKCVSEKLYLGYFHRFFDILLRIHRLFAIYICHFIYTFSDNTISFQTSETSKHRILMKLDRFWNFVSVILDPLCGISKIQFEICNQRPREPLSTDLCENRRISKISWSPYWIRHFEKWKFDVKFVISDPKSPGASE